jgi:hypothetical protein
MESADIYVLSKLRWQLFGSLTFKQSKMPDWHRMKMLFALFRKVAKDFHVYFPAIPFVVRLEPGEIGERMHNHFLLSGLPDNAPSVPTCFAMMRYWERLGGGIPRVRVFDPRLSGVDYVAECLGYHMDGADIYESAKFGSNGRELFYSRAVWDESKHFRRRVDR